MANFSFVARFGLLLLVSASAAVSSEEEIDPLFSSRPVPSLIAFAEARKIPLERIDLASPDQPPGEGDQVTMLITLVRGEAREQWVTTLTGDELTSAEAALKPQPAVTIHTFTGQKLRFARTRAALDVYLAGPFLFSAENRPSREPLETRRRTLVTAEYLVHGLEPFARSAWSLVRGCAPQAGANMTDTRRDLIRFPKLLCKWAGASPRNFS